jgi:hypothetical protein
VILGTELILYQDLDSAHVSYDVIKWMDQCGINHLEGPPSSPDLSIMETWVQPLRRTFAKELCTTAQQGINRFYRYFEESKEEKVNKAIDSYPARLHEVIERTQGAATKY